MHIEQIAYHLVPREMKVIFFSFFCSNEKKKYIKKLKRKSAKLWKSRFNKKDWKQQKHDWHEVFIYIRVGTVRLMIIWHFIIQVNLTFLQNFLQRKKKRYENESTWKPFELLGESEYSFNWMKKKIKYILNFAPKTSCQE